MGYDISPNGSGRSPLTANAAVRIAIRSRALRVLLAILD